MKTLLNADTFPQFCHQAFWGRWNTAVINIAVLLFVTFWLVKGGQHVGLLLRTTNLTADLITTCLVVAAILAIGLFDKQRAR